MTGYFDDLAAALARSDVTEAELAEIAEAHHMHIVGPPSQRYVYRFGHHRLPLAWASVRLPLPWWPRRSKLHQTVPVFRSRRSPGRLLATILFTEIVGATDLAVKLGDESWQRLGGSDCVGRRPFSSGLPVAAMRWEGTVTQRAV